MLKKSLREIYIIGNMLIRALLFKISTNISGGKYLRIAKGVRVTKRNDIKLVSHCPLNRLWFFNS